MKRAAVLGKGSLAAHACETIAALPDMVLDTVVPVAQEPDWDIPLSGYVTKHWPATRVLRSGDWRDLDGRFDLVFSVFYDRIIGPDLIDRASCSGIRVPPRARSRPIGASPPGDVASRAE